MYNIKDISLISGLTERTLRNYLKKGILVGEKQDGVWFFSEEQLMNFLDEAVVKAAMRANRNAILFDFLNDKFKSENSACILLHLPKDKSMSVATFFCDAVNKRSGLRMRFDTLNGLNQVILAGNLESVREVVEEYQKARRS